MEETAIQPVNQNHFLRLQVKPDELIRYQGEVADLITKALKLDVDFGVIPGTQKPSLYQPGAERINLAFGVRPEYDIIEKELDHDRPILWNKRKKTGWDKIANEPTWTITQGESVGLYRYVIKCRLINKASGQEVGEACGSASTLESRYVDRPRENENTVLQQAQKRAFVRATRNTYGISDRFTQDVEDMDLGTGTPQESNGEEPPADIRIEFGKHKGKMLSECPRDYIHWLSDKATTPEIKQAAINFLKKPKDAPPLAPPTAPHPEPEKPATAPSPAPQTGKESTEGNGKRQKVILEIQAVLLDLSPLSPMDALRDYTGYELLDEIPDEKLNEIKVKLTTKRDAKKAKGGK